MIDFFHYHRKLLFRTSISGDTNVLVAVYGPADCRESRQLIDRCAIEVSFRPKDGIPGVAEKFLENTIRNICETVIMTKLHPRSQITVVVQVIQDHGSVSFFTYKTVAIAAAKETACRQTELLFAFAFF